MNNEKREKWKKNEIKTDAAAADGADAALVVAPYYNKPTQQGFIEHYKAIAETIDLPICVYNIPGRTGKNIEPDSICRLGELENIALVKLKLEYVFKAYLS